VAPLALEAIAAHARSTAPEECCGLLVGTPAEIVESVPSRNLAVDPMRGYLLDPVTHIDARRRARARGLFIVGFYHSHPNSEPVPSPRDAEDASYTDHVYLIVRPMPAGCEARAFEWLGDRFAEISLRVE
jgi:proteasome lid subunit RPN8/RPN11